MQSIDSEFSHASNPSIISLFTRNRTVGVGIQKSGANLDITFSGPEDVFPVNFYDRLRQSLSLQRFVYNQYIELFVKFSLNCHLGAIAATMKWGGRGRADW
jgi:hypothetical protein